LAEEEEEEDEEFEADDEEAVEEEDGGGAETGIFVSSATYLVTACSYSKMRPSCDV